MQFEKIDNMLKGWFIGNFFPSIYQTPEFEVAIQNYKKNQEEAPHYHKKAHEVTVVLSGQVSMNDKILNEGDIVLVFPNETVSFKALKKSKTLVIKFPSIRNDKFEEIKKIQNA